MRRVVSSLWVASGLFVMGCGDVVADPAGWDFVEDAVVPPIQEPVHELSEPLEELDCEADPASCRDATHKCYWMESRTGRWEWVPTMDVLGTGDTKEACFALDSCSGGLGQSGGGCYKWALSPDDDGVNW